MIKVGIDASNIKAGGGLTHLLQLIKYANPKHAGIDKLIIWGGNSLDKIPDREWLIKSKQDALNKNFFFQSYWKLFILPKLVKQCDILFAPGGTYSSKKHPYVSMSQNMLVFEKKERNRFPLSLTKLRYLTLNYLQRKSFKNASGIIFISEYAKSFITENIRLKKEIRSTVIYHGISEDFKNSPKEQLPISHYTIENPFRILYVSIVNFYKHQWNVIKAVKSLRKKGLPIELVLIGPYHAKALPLLNKELEGAESFVKYLGKKDYEEISNFYKKADMFLFASTCENMPNILVEAMSAGLPIASSNYGPMPEILRDAGDYFDPTNITEVENSIKRMLESSHLRESLSQKAFLYSQDYTWEKCANETFEFISKVYSEKHN